MQTATGVELDGQYRALRETVGFVDRGDRGTLSVSGPEAAGLLQGQLTNDVEALEVGGGCYAALLNRKGHIQADMRVLRVGESELELDTEPGVAATVARHMQMYGVGREAEVSETTGKRAIVSLIGPDARTTLGGVELNGEHRHVPLEIGGVAARAVATDLGADLVVAAGDAAALREALAAAGAVGVSEDAAEIVRIESGRPRFGREMTTRTMPAEAGIVERAISFTKGCYIGQETVARLHYKGKPNRHLRGLRLAAPVEAGNPVRIGDRELGVVGTAVVSPAHGAIALAILRREAVPGDGVAVGDSVEAEVVEPPF